MWHHPGILTVMFDRLPGPEPSQVYPQGLTLLGDKIDELIDRTARRTRVEIADAVMMPRSPPARISLTSPPRQRMQRMQVMKDLLVEGAKGQGVGSRGGEPLKGSSPAGCTSGSPRFSGRGCLGASIPPNDDAVGPTLNARSPIVQGEGLNAFRVGESSLDSPLGGERVAACSQPRDKATVSHHDGDRRDPRHSTKAPVSKGAALTAAGFMWNSTQGACTPLVRQVLTYEEIAMLKQQASAKTPAEAPVADLRATGI